MISVVITSYNRPDLLVKTVNSLMGFIDYPIDEFIIVEDSGSQELNKYLSQIYPEFHLILHEQNKGAYESIDEAYSYISTKYVLHVEDDWQFTKGRFIEPAIKILENDPMIMQVNLSNEENIPIEPEILKRGGVDYRIMGDDVNGWWHGFTNRPNIRSMAGYEATKPWTRFKHPDLSIHECMVGQEYYRLGYKAAVLNDYYCTHIGRDRCTWHN